jgi:hypothetical protein
LERRRLREERENGSVLRFEFEQKRAMQVKRKAGKGEIDSYPTSVEDMVWSVPDPKEGRFDLRILSNLSAKTGLIVERAETRRKVGEQIHGCGVGVRIFLFFASLL